MRPLLLLDRCRVKLLAHDVVGGDRDFFGGYVDGAVVVTTAGAFLVGGVRDFHRVQRCSAAAGDDVSHPGLLRPAVAVVVTAEDGGDLVLLE